MTEKEREEWTKSLKVGDVVANEVSHGCKREKGYEFFEIKNITKKGNIRLTNGILLNSNGTYHKFDAWTSVDYHIEPATEELLEYEKDRQEYNQLLVEVNELCSGFRKKEYDKEDLIALKEILERGR